MGATRFVPIEVFSKKATATEASANKVIFTIPYTVTGAMAQIIKAADNTLYSTGQTIEIKVNSTTGVCTVEVAATAILANDVVNLLVFN